MSLVYNCVLVLLIEWLISVQNVIAVYKSNGDVYENKCVMLNKV